MMTYGFVKELNLPFNQAIQVTTEQLKHEGFGVLTRIELHDTLKEIAVEIEAKLKRVFDKIG